MSTAPSPGKATGVEKVRQTPGFVDWRVVLGTYADRQQKPALRRGNRSRRKALTPVSDISLVVAGSASHKVLAVFCQGQAGRSESGGGGAIPGSHSPKSQNRNLEDLRFDL
jgi:hypothetical protein